MSHLILEAGTDIQSYPIHLPWWSILIALAVCLILILPIGIVMAMTNLQISIYLVSQILAGLMFPGRGVANIIFVTYTYVWLSARFSLGPS